MKKKILRILLIVFTVFALVFLLTIYMVVNPLFFPSGPIKMAIPADNQRLYQDVKTLTSILPARNSFHPESLNKAAAYIEGQFNQLDCRVQIQTFEADRTEYKNVIASFGPAEGERVVVGAHYDVCGNQPGADDNASAVAGLLELGRLLHELKPQLPYRIDLAAYALEEPPYFNTRWMGSAVHAKSLKDGKVKVKAMICLEMIGYFTDQPRSQGFPIPLLKLFYPTTGNYIVVVGKLWSRSLVRNVKEAMLQVADIDVRSINAPAALPGVDLSDHKNFWKHGFDAVMITDTAFYRNPNYHRITDTIDTLDFAKMAEVVRGVYWAMLSI
jgi:hypothetical protein